ncbi:TonB-dependent receptor domain-containing protein [Hephaestia sp. GCM10023244]|uniref:TonB-dependent receptor domain-containing protein n=1 Tax=unclassified Hephaestia TaxID=2631281 RepID=UPI00207790F2|nr:TonB-dependent receptor [Hephaestia sp. MAHUQ-44]MCM8732288.1 TonB-dependent receptor [Hephaestia sp. MAHUQ-44]
MKNSQPVFACARHRAALKDVSITAIALASLAIAVPAYAQAESESQQDEIAAANDAGSSSIVVTGSRLGSGFTAPTPVTTIGAGQIEDRALTSVAELAYEIPQLRINQNVGKSSEPVGQNVADLRALGAARTLLLLDGRRLAATNPFGGVDTNIFPVSLISGVEVVTGGASAAYGSDAVAGVINFSLEKKMEGVKLDASYGVSDYGDFNRPVLSGAAGHSFLDGRLNITIAGDFYRNTGQTTVASRPWGRGNPVLFNNPAYTPTNGQTKNFIAYNALYSKMTFGGLINAPVGSPLHGIQFGPGGTPEPFTYGATPNTTFMIGGDGVSIQDEGNILPHITRYSGYSRASFEASKNLTLWADLLWSRVEVLSDLAPNYDNGTLTIHQDNAFLPQSIRQIMIDNNIPSFAFGRMNLDDGFSENNSVSRATRYAVGAEGNFGSWDWDVYAQRSENTFRQESVNNRINARWTQGIDAVISPVTGQPVCRINVDANPNNDNAACVPINAFGAGSISQAALDWYRGTSFYDARMSQNSFGANLNGSPFNTWAGEVKIAVGGEYRREEIKSVSDPISEVSGWRSINQKSFAGDLDVWEVYAEAAVPLAKDLPFANNIEFNGAIRYTDYSSSGGVTTWKAGLNYSPIEDIRFRGTLSRDIRAANVNELFSGQNQVINTINDPRNNVAGFVTQLTGGNPNLLPEKADTKAVGVVVQPSALPGLSASIDYYSIKIDGAITAVPSQTIVNNCFIANLPEFCAFVTQNAANAITLVQATLINAQTIETAGVDFELSYRRPLAAGTLGSRLLVNYVDKLALTTSGVTTSSLGDIATDPGGQPRWKANFDLTYAGGPLRLGAYVRYIGGGKFRSIYVDDVDLPADQNRVKGRAYLDLSASYKLTDNIEIYGKIDNLLNTDPPVIPNNIVQPTVSNSQMYDRIGRYYVSGVRLRF